ncbi:uncharacterized protein LOC126251669 isoform X1 [Schistocerca nitens]|uniref:uncharacterized protein LOC126251669 isoform X1 n=1 Tax=Schistocerca nitens TaxID=7011 RepID=UPI0021194807|nr:uncharacterized protein LOC126251669 isoform X1 [Schistocerca nitens]XP_049808200.1 uncharacterized protein LOC126251669 isoform X1 [Schistocerca nitens]
MDQTTAYFTRRHIYALATDVKIRHQHLTAKTKVLSTTTTTTTTTGAGFDSQVRDEYSQLVLQALAVLLPFPATFSAYAATKTKYRLTGSAPDMHLRLFSFVPNTEQLIKNKKTSYLPLYGNNFIN